MPSYADRGGYQSGSPRQRLISSLLSAAIIVIALLIAIYQTAVAPLREKAKNPVTFNIEGEDADTGAKSPEPAKKAEKVEKDQVEQPKVAVETPVQPIEKPTQTAEKPAFSFLKLSKSDMAAADIGGMKSSGSGSPSGGGNSGSTYGPGEGRAAPRSIMQTGSAGPPMRSSAATCPPMLRPRAGAWSPARRSITITSRTARSSAIATRFRLWARGAQCGVAVPGDPAAHQR
ncbi:hypothetical protein ACFSLT_18190 [Novosphingobium resinovorum]